jgi:hypothetical protein
MRTQTLALYTLPLLDASVDGFFRNLVELTRCIRFDALHGCETCPLEAHFQSREQPKVTQIEIRRVRWLGDDTISDVWLGAETTVPACHLSRRFLCRTCTVTLSRRYELMVHQTVHVTEFREPFDCPSYI